MWTNRGPSLDPNQSAPCGPESLGFRPAYVIRRVRRSARAVVRPMGRSAPPPTLLPNGGPKMKRILVWDIPVRLFHWLLAGSFVGAFVIANTVDDESTPFVVHMWLG